MSTHKSAATDQSGPSKEEKQKAVKDMFDKPVLPSQFKTPHVLHGLVKKTVHPRNEYFVPNTQDQQGNGRIESDVASIPESQEVPLLPCFDLGFHLTPTQGSAADELSPSLKLELSKDLDLSDFQGLSDESCQISSSLSDEFATNLSESQFNESALPREIPDASQLLESSPVFGVTATQYRKKTLNPEVLRIVQEETDAYLEKLCSSQTISNFLDGRDEPVKIRLSSRHAIKQQLQKLVEMKNKNVKIVEKVHSDHVSFQCILADNDQVLDEAGNVLPFAQQLATRYVPDPEIEVTDDKYKKNFMRVVQNSKVSQLTGYQEALKTHSHVINVYNGHKEKLDMPMTEFAKRSGPPEYMNPTALCRLIHRDTRDWEWMNVIKYNMNLPLRAPRKSPYNRALRTMFSAFTEGESSALVYDYGNIIDEVSQVHKIQMPDDCETLGEAFAAFLKAYESTTDFDRLTHGAGPALMGLSIHALKMYMAPYLQTPLKTETPGAQDHDFKNYVNILEKAIAPHRDMYAPEDEKKTLPDKKETKEHKEPKEPKESRKRQHSGSSTSTVTKPNKRSKKTVEQEHDYTSLSDNNSFIDDDDFDDFSRPKQQRRAPKGGKGRGKNKPKKKKNPESIEDLIEPQRGDSLETTGLRMLLRQNIEAVRRIESSMKERDKKTVRRLQSEADALKDKLLIVHTDAVDEDDPSRHLPKNIRKSYRQSTLDFKPKQTTSTFIDAQEISSDSGEQSDDNSSTSSSKSAPKLSPHAITKNSVPTSSGPSEKTPDVITLGESNAEDQVEQQEPDIVEFVDENGDLLRGHDGKPLSTLQLMEQLKSIRAEKDQLATDLLAQRNEREADERMAKKRKMVDHLIKEVYYEHRKMIRSGKSSNDKLKEVEAELQLALEKETFGTIAFESELDIVEKAKTSVWTPKPVTVTKSKMDLQETGITLLYKVCFCNIKDEVQSDNEIIVIGDDTPEKTSKSETSGNSTEQVKTANVSPTPRPEAKKKSTPAEVIEKEASDNESLKSIKTKQKMSKDKEKKKITSTDSAEEEKSSSSEDDQDKEETKGKSTPPQPAGRKSALAGSRRPGNRSAVEKGSRVAFSLPDEMTNIRNPSRRGRHVGLSGGRRKNTLATSDDDGRPSDAFNVMQRDASLMWDRVKGMGDVVKSRRTRSSKKADTDSD